MRKSLRLNLENLDDEVQQHSFQYQVKSKEEVYDEPLPGREDRRYLFEVTVVVQPKYSRRSDLSAKFPYAISTLL